MFYVAGIVYFSGLIFFLINCARESLERGKRPGAVVLAVALLWPAFLIVVGAAVTWKKYSARTRNLARSAD